MIDFKKKLYLIAALACFTSLALAGPMGDLKTGSGGTVTVTLTSIVFNPDPTSVPAGAPWNAEVATLTSLTFAGCPSGTLGAAGCLSAGEAIDVLPINTATVLPLANFFTFAAHPTLSYSLSVVGPGSGTTNCAALAVFASCSVFAGSPIVLTLEPMGSTEVSLNLSGTATDGASPASTWFGHFQSPISGMTPGQIQTFFCPSGTCTTADFMSGRSESSSQSGDFVASTVPEPGTVSLFLLGGAALIGIGRKRFGK
jgi:hypothetical protein